MLFRKPKLIKVDVTKTRRNRDGHFAGKGRPYHVVPLSFQASSNGIVNGVNFDGSHCVFFPDGLCEGKGRMP